MEKSSEAQNNQVGASILSADFACLAQDVDTVAAAGADSLHVDVMDGHFVPNLTIGPGVVASLRRVTSLPLDVHLMISDPGFFLEAFINAGSNAITVHAEACQLDQLRKIHRTLRDRGVRMGISLNPATPVHRLVPALPLVDLVLVMSVNPGFGGQAFMPEVIPKIKELRERFTGEIAVDGGITDQTGPAVVAAGATTLIAGSFIFNAADRRQAIRSLQRCGIK